MIRPNIFFATLLCASFCFATTVFAAPPTISGVTNAILHDQSITISGSDFGTKPQAAPYVWDNASGTDPLQKWDVVYPYTNDTAFRFAYRTPAQVTLANGVIGGVALPHNHIQKYICGAHYNSTTPDAYSGLDMGAVKNNQEGYAYTYISYYRTIDPHWFLHTTCPPDPDYYCDHNFKEYDYAEGYGEYGNGNNIYFGDGAGANPLDNIWWGAMYAEGMNPTIYSVNTEFMAWYPETGGVFSSVGVPGPGQGWQKIELILKHRSTDGFHKIYENNMPVWDVFLNDDGLPAGPRAEMPFGGFSRESGSAESYKNNWRYYADVYYDHSLARVMLANNSDYTKATIIEPQILSLWSDGSITVTVNLGKLPDTGRAYLFVFNKDNVRNAAGYPITLGNANIARPAAPAGLTVR